MGYFSNSTEGDQFESKFCHTCVHNHEEHSCPCLDAHLLWNYDECNKPDSVLHKMILRDEKGFNSKCIFFKDSNK